MGAAAGLDGGWRWVDWTAHGLRCKGTFRIKLCQTCEAFHTGRNVEISSTMDMSIPQPIDSA
jgi:hypothetical protein